MTEKLREIQNKMRFTKKTQSVVKTMKAFSSSKINEFRSSFEALMDYKEVISRNLTVMAENGGLSKLANSSILRKPTTCIAIGSDHGMVGGFNEALAGYIEKTDSLSKDVSFIVIGGILAETLAKRNLKQIFSTPLSVDRIPLLLGDLLDEIEKEQSESENFSLSVFYNTSSDKGLFEPTHRDLLPLSSPVLHSYIDKKWETHQIPELIGKESSEYTQAIIQEFIYVALFQMCSASLLAEHSTRLASMQEAERKIEELLDNLGHEFNQVRQDLIDRELFDVIAGFRSLEKK